MHSSFKNGNTETLLSPQPDYRFWFGLCYDRTLKGPFYCMDCVMLSIHRVCSAKQWRRSINGHSYTYRFRLMRTMHLKKKNNNNLRALSLMRGYDRFNLVYIVSGSLSYM